jgi:hypothetical protein
VALLVRTADGDAVKLSEIMTQQQLEHLLSLALSADLNVASSGASLPPNVAPCQPPIGHSWASWIAFTVSTFLLDLLEGKEPFAIGTWLRTGR